MSDVAPFPLIDVAGPPRERGRQYGALARGRIEASVGFYRRQMEAAGFGWAETAEMARAFLPAIAAFDAGMEEEIRGIAEGAGQEVEAIVTVNARTEMLWQAKRAGRPARPAENDACTGVIVLPEASADRRLIHAQNWDWREECVRHAVVLRVRRDDAPDLLTFTEAGALARSGLNAAGISITANFLESDRDYRQAGVPLPLIRRKALDQTRYALALHAVHTTPKSASNNMMLCHSAGVGIDVECAPDESFALYPEGGLLVHANHWASPAAQAKLRDTGIAGTPDSLFRDLRVRGLLAPKRGRISVADVEQALFDDFDSPWSVCRPPRPSTGGYIGATVAMVVMVPGEGLMRVAPMPALNRFFAEYRLRDAPAAALEPAQRASQ